MSSSETDRADRVERQRQLEANLAEARRDRDRLRDMGDEPAPERDS